MLVYQRVAHNTQDQFNMDLLNSSSFTDIWETTCPKPSHSTELQRCNLTNVLGILEGKLCLKNHLNFESWLSALQVLSFQEYHWSYSPENKHWNWKSSHGKSKCFTKPSFLQVQNTQGKSEGSIQHSWFLPQHMAYRNDASSRLVTTIPVLIPLQVTNKSQGKSNFCTHRIHVWYIYLHASEWLIFMVA